MSGKPWVIILLFISGFTFSASAQYYHRLAASDFQGTPPTGDLAMAFTHCNVQYDYNMTGSQGNYNCSFNVYLVFDKNKSYIRLNFVRDQEELQRVLRHEQGHYNIAYLLKCELASALSHHHYTANYDREIKAVFEQVNAKYQKINADYERQTVHMQNDAKQEEWNAWFSKAIDNTPVKQVYAER